MTRTIAQLVGMRPLIATYTSDELGTEKALDFGSRFSFATSRGPPESRSRQSSLAILPSAASRCSHCAFPSEKPIFVWRTRLDTLSAN